MVNFIPSMLAIQTAINNMNAANRNAIAARKRREEDDRRRKRIQEEKKK
jgi:hypothetical protein